MEASFDRSTQGSNQGNLGVEGRRRLEGRSTKRHRAPWATQQHSATASAEESLQLSQNRYAGGVDTYLQVVIWQTTALTNERNDIDIVRRRLEANVLLIKAIGGGWDTSQLPKV